MILLSHLSWLAHKEVDGLVSTAATSIPSATLVLHDSSPSAQKKFKPIQTRYALPPARFGCGQRLPAQTHAPSLTPWHQKRWRGKIIVVSIAWKCVFKYLRVRWPRQKWKVLRKAWCQVKGPVKTVQKNDHFWTKKLRADHSLKSPKRRKRG